MSAGPDDIRRRIDNALAVLGATPTNDVRAVRQTVELLKSTLTELRGAFDELEAQLEVVTAPDRNAARDVVALDRELRSAKAKNQDLEQRLALARAELEADRQLQADDRTRLAELEKQSRQFEDLLLKDDDAFGRYLDRAIDADERKRGRRPPSR